MRSFFAATLFWILCLAGGAVLAPCLILPAWIEYQSASAQLAAADARVRNLEEENLRLARLIDHQLHDPAYNERQARAEFGLHEPGVETVYVQRPPARTGNASPAPAAAAPPADSLVRPELAAFVERSVQQFPQAQLFLHESTRTRLMILGGGLLLIALVVLGRPIRYSELKAPADQRPRLSSAG